MKKFAKVLAVVMAAALVLSMAACNNKPEEKTYNVGILQLVQHEALDAATKGFRDALTQKLGDKVKFDEQNAQGDANTCTTIANGFVSSKVDLIMANATPALVACATATADIPVLGTSITEYGAALNLENFDGTVGTNVSGTSDLAPLDKQAEMIKEFFPEAKKVGLIYCTAEANSIYQVNTIKTHLEELGYEAKLYPFSDSNDLAAVTTNATKEVDVIYVPTDNTVASNAGIVDNICAPAKIPVFAGEEGACKGCGLATLSIDYYDLGYATGIMAYKVLTGESKISEMPIEYAPDFTNKYVPERFKAFNLEAPEGYVAIS